MGTLAAPVFVHCRYGCDRSGTIIACYRIRRGWSSELGLQEAEEYSLSTLERRTSEYILGLGKASAGR